MVAIKTWIPNELLKSADLNTAFLTAAQGYMPGAVCQTGTGVAIVADAAAVELPMGAPNAGADHGGYYQSGIGRIVIPAGLGGWHLVSYSVTHTGGTKGDMGSVLCQGAGAQGQRHWFARGGTGAFATVVCFVGNIAAGVTLFVDGNAFTTGATLTLANFRIARLATPGLFA